MGAFSGGVISDSTFQSNSGLGCTIMLESLANVTIIHSSFSNNSGEFSTLGIVYPLIDNICLDY